MSPPGLAYMARAKGVRLHEKASDYEAKAEKVASRVHFVYASPMLLMGAIDFIYTTYTMKFATDTLPSYTAKTKRKESVIVTSDSTW